MTSNESSEKNAFQKTTVLELKLNVKNFTLTSH